MKKGALKFVFAVLFLLPVCANAGYIDIYEDTVVNSDLNAIVRVHGSAQITVLPGGSATVFFLLDTSSALVYGGHASYDAQDSSILNLYDGTFGSVRYTDSLAKIYVYGENFQYPSNPYYQSVFLRGNWLNGPAFNIYFRGLPQPFGQALGTNIFLVPEPCTVGLLCFGFLVLRRSIKTFHK